jgi:hypothetical protein
VQLSHISLFIVPIQAGAPMGRRASNSFQFSSSYFARFSICVHHRSRLLKHCAAGEQLVFSISSSLRFYTFLCVSSRFFASLFVSLRFSLYTLYTLSNSSTAPAITRDV